MHVDGRKELVEFDQSFSSFYNDCKTSSKQKNSPGKLAIIILVQNLGKQTFQLV